MSIEKDLKLTHKTGLESKVLINLTYTTRQIEEALSSLLKEYGLTIQQFNVLRILRGQQGKPASLNCVQERMVDRSSNTTRLVDKLIAKGLTNRRICPSNRRKVEIEITEKGLQILSETDPKINALNNAQVKNFTKEELTQFNEFLDRLRE
ncbi:MAG: MarR family transcriptional regulator [Cytophagaceae bacterium]|nr:MarR family transcriptional regulator [Cytophagaceae bacterium]|tara:strand:- start:3251 stop:3703 length:453 start_codon:yes stop_codon:yes gene_type:complete